MPSSGNYADVVSIFEYLNSNKYRVVYFIGDEHIYRTLVCAVIETNIKKGIICKVDIQRKFLQKETIWDGSYLVLTRDLYMNVDNEAWDLVRKVN